LPPASGAFARARRGHPIHDRRLADRAQVKTGGKERLNHGRRAGPILAGGLLILLAACSAQADLPDMPAFAGTAAYLDMQERIRKSVEAGEVVQANLKEGYRAGQTRRGQYYLKQMALVTERMRQQEQFKRLERERFERMRAQEAQRNYAQYFETLRHREVIQRESEATVESARRQGDGSFLRAVQARAVPRQAGAGQASAGSAGNRTPVP